jgi:phenylalanyl-tRNA synthetase alpha chain
LGQKINVLKTFVQQKFDEASQRLEESATSTDDGTDYSMPTQQTVGSRHPLNIIQNQILEIFAKLGFEVGEGPEIEHDWYKLFGTKFSRKPSCPRYAGYLFCG